MQSALDNTMDALGAEGGAAIPSGTSQMRTGDGRAELTFSSLTDAEMDDLGVSILPLETAPQPTPQTPPPTYSIIFDNVDFFIRPHYQSTRQANKSIHWIHHMAVEDRVPTNHLPRDKPTQPIISGTSLISGTSSLVKTPTTICELSLLSWGAAY